MPITIVRPFNTYGPRQSARAVIPTIITQLLSGFQKIKLGNLHPTRDILFIKDTVEGFIAISKSDELIGQEVNIATNTEISISDLAKKIIQMINPTAVIETDNIRIRPQKSEVERLLGSNEKLKNYTNWQQKYTLEEGLKETIDWFKEKDNLRWYKTCIYNL